MTLTTGPRAAMISIAIGAVALSSLTMGLSPASAKPKLHQPAGGANQVEGTHGKVGQMLFDGHWRFQVLGVHQSDSYTMKVPSAQGDYGKYASAAEYDSASYTFTPKAGYTFVSVDCLAKNGQNKPQQLDFYFNDPNTALTDNQSNSYPPIAYDMMTFAPWATKAILPGAAVHFTILFAVSSGTKPQDVLVTLKNYSDHKGRDMRVSLSS